MSSHHLETFRILILNSEFKINFGSLHRATLGEFIAREQVKRSGKSISFVLIPSKVECSEPKSTLIFFILNYEF